MPSAFIEMELNLRKAETVRKQVVDAKNLVTKDAQNMAVCFDLQKMQKSPSTKGNKSTKLAEENWKRLK